MSIALEEALSTETESRTPLATDELLRQAEFHSFELVELQQQGRGEGNECSEVATSLAHLLMSVIVPKGLGTVYGSSCCYRCFEDVTGDRNRKPDVSFIAKGRLSIADKRLDAFTIAPDLAVEVISKYEEIMELDERIGEYLKAGVKLVWVINPRAETVTIWRSDGTGGRLNANGELSGESVIPGFKCKVSEIFASLHEV